MMASAPGNLLYGDYYRPGNNGFQGDYYRPGSYGFQSYSPLSYGAQSYGSSYWSPLRYQPQYEPRPFEMTCRAWIKGWCKPNFRCPYAHFSTPFLSPQEPYTCWFWSQGRCCDTAETCQYQHNYDALCPYQPRSFGVDRECLVQRPSPLRRRNTV